MEKVLLLLILLLLSWDISGALAGGVGLANVTHLEMFVDELPDMPRLQAYRIRNSFHEPGNLTIGMYEKIWIFDGVSRDVMLYFMGSHMRLPSIVTNDMQLPPTLAME